MPLPASDVWRLFSPRRPLQPPPLHWLWEVSARMVARMTVLLLKCGAPFALLPLAAAAPMRLLGAAQAFAPDCVTAALLSPWMPGDPFYMLRLMRGPGAKKKA
jgi:hypothetical protein